MENKHSEDQSNRRYINKLRMKKRLTKEEFGILEYENEKAYIATLLPDEAKKFEEEVFERNIQLAHQFSAYIESLDLLFDESTGFYQKLI